jgi:acyl-CoA reductase-like NAD-dependent aldehyde dehydrogenase
MNELGVDWIGRSDSLHFSIQNFIDGRFQPATSDRSLEIVAPRDGRVLGRFLAGEARDVDQAVNSAKVAFSDGRWSKMSLQRRSDVLRKFAGLVEAHREELALLESIDVGKPIGATLNVDVPATAATIRFAAEAADKIYGKVYGVDQTSLSYELRRPVGVVAAIIGWNFPLLLAAQKIGPVLATGNCLVLKPSELTSISASRIAQLAIEAGVPDGVLNVIQGDAVAGSALANHCGVNLLTFTGSTRTGKALLVAAGRSNMKRLILECGGKAPTIVFDDCPSLDSVAAAIVASAFWNQGQVCVASSRVLVQDSVKDELLKQLILKTSEWSCGDPLNPETKFGALISKNHMQKVLGYIELGSMEGARLVHQSSSTPPFAEGFYVPPTIFDSVAPEQRIAQEEIFGPVLSILSFRDEDDAVKIANQTIYGLSATIWTQHMGRAHRMSQAVDAGWIVVNATDKPAGGLGEGLLPVGGLKESGIGVEGGIEGLQAYTDKTAIQVFV